MSSDSESDNESPEVVSSVTMKSEREQELRNMFAQKRKLREELTLKRKHKAEKLANQKKEKLLKKQDKIDNQEDDGEDLDDDSKPQQLDKEKKNSGDIESAGGNIETLEKLTVEKRKAPTHSKIYPKFNIVVEPLTKVKNQRASAALSFKEKRLAKIPRESLSNLIAYKEKMLVKNT